LQPTVVEIQTEALGLSAVEVEQLITVPLEADLLAGIAGLT
jgi:Cu/Ag efflux pump CusA